MSQGYDLILKGGTLVTPAGIGAADVAVSAGRIAAIGDLSANAAGEVLDARGLHVLPGAIDSQVHFREPGLEHKEDLASGAAAAALGGIVAVCEMPNTSPSTLTAEDLAAKLARAKGRSWVDHAFFLGAAAENAADLGRLERLPGACGVKVFMGSSTGSLLVEDDETLLQVLKSGSRRVAVHAEDEMRLRERLRLVKGEGVSVALHPEWRDAETAYRASDRLLGLARQAGRRVHVLHVSTAEEIPLLARNKDLATVEVTPQHLSLSAPDCYERLGTLAQMNPPIRTGAHREALWRALAAGVVDVIGSDHAPHDLEEKAKAYPTSPAGMPGVQTLIPIMLDHVNAGRLSLERLVDLISAGPARVYGIAGKGRIAVGYDADFSVVDLGARREITKSWLASKCGWSPFEGMTVTGWPQATVIRGKIVMREGELIGTPAGQPLRFQETLAAG